MAFSLLDPGPAPAVFDCSRFDGFCPKDAYRTELKTLNPKPKPKPKPKPNPKPNPNQDAYSVGYRNALNPADRVPSAAPTGPRGHGSGGAALLLTAAAAVALASRRRRDPCPCVK